jgi:hypothetical protein
MAQDQEEEWRLEDLDFVRREIHTEYPEVSRALIELLVSESRRRIAPSEGAVKLLAEARQCLRRRLERRQESFRVSSLWRDKARPDLAQSDDARSGDRWGAMEGD